MDSHFSTADQARFGFETLMRTLELNGLRSRDELETLLEEHEAFLAEETNFEYARNTFALLRELGKKYPLILGRTRIVALTTDYALKIPVNGEGFIANANEAQAYENYRDGVKYALPMAKTSIDEENGITFARAELVEIYRGSRRDLPSWVDWIDCAQVGHTREGVLVAYDL